MSLKRLRDPKYRGNLSQLPMCQLLLSSGKKKDTGLENQTPILFIKQESLKFSGWLNIEGEGIPYGHLYQGAKQVDNGIAFIQPQIHWLASSPRLIEVTDNGFQEGIGRKGEMLGSYETAEGQKLYEKYKGLVTLRTLHLIYLVGKNKQLLHRVPFTLSVHGGGAAILGQQINSFFRELEVVQTDAQNLEIKLENPNAEEEFFTLNEEARCLAIFKPILEVEKVGTEKTSDICAVVGYEAPTVETIDSFFNFENEAKLQGAQKSFSKDTNFAERYLKQFEKFHPVQDVSKLSLATTSILNDQLVGDSIDNFDMSMSRFVSKSATTKALGHYTSNDNEVLDDSNIPGF